MPLTPLPPSFRDRNIFYFSWNNRYPSDSECIDIQKIFETSEIEEISVLFDSQKLLFHSLKLKFTIYIQVILKERLSSLIE